MRERARPVLAALSFLTALPVGRGRPITQRDLRRGAAAFPIIGGAVGAAVGVVAWASSLALPPWPAAALGVAAGVVLTAGLHLDGLADVADGIGAGLAGRAPADALQDPRLGTFGVVALALDLLLKVSVLAALVVRGFPWATVAAGALARVAPIALAAWLPYVGRGAGGWTDRIRGRTAVVAGTIASGIAAASVALGDLTVPEPTAFAAGHAALATASAITVVAIVTALLGRWGRRRLGGVTGDVFGAAGELGETLALTVVLAAA